MFLEAIFFQEPDVFFWDAPSVVKKKSVAILWVQEGGWMVGQRVQGQSRFVRRIVWAVAAAVSPLLPASSIMHHTTHAAAAHSGGLRQRGRARGKERQGRGSSLTDRPRAAAWGGTEGGRAKGTPDQTLF